MITLLLNIIYSFLEFLINLLPTGGTLPSAVHTASTALGGYLHILDPLVPINTMLTCVTIVFGVEVALFLFKTLKWLISFIPQFGGKGV